MNPLLEKLETIKASLHDINEDMFQLRREEYRMNDEYREVIQDLYRSIIGNCYKRELELGTQYICIVDVPHEELTPMTTSFNPYQIPCLMISPTAEKPDGSELFEELSDGITYETIFYKYLPEVDGEPHFGELPKLVAISQDEFRHALWEFFTRFDHAIVRAGLRRSPHPQSES